MRARVSALQIDRKGVTVKTAQATSARASRFSPAARTTRFIGRSGLGMPRMFLHTAQMELPACAISATSSCTSAVRSRRRDSVGSCRWCADTQQCARVGVMCESDAPRYFDRLTARVSGRWGIDESAMRRPRQKILPLAPLSRTYGDRLLAIGDAAGLVKPTTGGGIYYSLVSAALAADVLIDALPTDDLSAERLAPYERLWRERLSAEFQAQLKLRLVAHRMSDADIEDLFELARTDGVMPIVRRTASFNRHRKLIVELLKHPPVRQLSPPPTRVLIPDSSTGDQEVRRILFEKNFS